LVGGFAEFVKVGDAGLNEWAFLEGRFGVIDDRCFECLGMAFGVEDLFAEGGEFGLLARRFGLFGRWGMRCHICLPWENLRV
jgi:hypothetical protein